MEVVALANADVDGDGDLQRARMARGLTRELVAAYATLATSSKAWAG